MTKLPEDFLLNSYFVGIVFLIYIVHVGFLSHFPEVSNQQKTTTTTTTTTNTTNNNNNNNNNNNSNRDNHPSGRTNIRSQRGSSAARASSPSSIRRWDPTFRRTKGFTVARKEGDARPYPSMGRTVYLSTFKTKKQPFIVNLQSSHGMVWEKAWEKSQLESDFFCSLLTDQKTANINFLPALIGFFVGNVYRWLFSKPT